VKRGVDELKTRTGVRFKGGGRGKKEGFGKKESTVT